MCGCPRHCLGSKMRIRRAFQLFEGCSRPHRLPLESVIQRPVWETGHHQEKGFLRYTHGTSRWQWCGRWVIIRVKSDNTHLQELDKNTSLMQARDSP